MASEEKSSGISIQTLVISALAAVAAAVIVPLVWERGTLIATAMTPVIVALVSEALRKPAEKITAVKPRATRRTGTGAAVRDPDFDPLPPGGREAAVRRDDPFGLRERPKLQRRHWWIALATGAAAFAVAVAVLTMSELVFGGPATRDGGNTTFFPGGTREREDATPAPTATATPEATETAPEATETPEPTATPTATPTESPAPLDAAPTPTATP